MCTCVYARWKLKHCDRFKCKNLLIFCMAMSHGIHTHRESHFHWNENGNSQMITNRCHQGIPNCMVSGSLLFVHAGDVSELIFFFSFQLANFEFCRYRKIKIIFLTEYIYKFVVFFGWLTEKDKMLTLDFFGNLFSTAFSHIELYT